MTEKTELPGEVPDHLLLARRDLGGKWVLLRSTQRVLGWVVPCAHQNQEGVAKLRLAAYVHLTAFRGGGAEDKGSMFDLVHPSLYIFNERDHWQHPLGCCLNEADGATRIWSHLDQNQAPALGYPRHPKVKVHAGRR